MGFNRIDDGKRRHSDSIKLLAAFSVAAILLFSSLAFADAMPNARPSKGFVSAVSVPRGAGFYLDGVYRGRTPLVVSGVSYGVHTAVFQKSGYQNYTNTSDFNIVYGSVKKMNAILEPVRVNASLMLASYPGEAQVYLNGSMVGTTPYCHGLYGPCNTLNISAPWGAYELVFSKQGYVENRSYFWVGPGGAFAFMASLAPNGTIEATSVPSDAAYLRGAGLA